MNIQFIKSKEKQQIAGQLNEDFGISELNYLLIESGKEKIRGFSGSLSKEEIMKLGKLANIELIGAYLIKKESKTDLRLSFDACIILKDQITKNIVEIDDEKFNSWIRGNDIEVSGISGNPIVKYKEDFFGCGKSNGIKIFNYVPKDRRLRK
ncbi:hypothetical protein J4217_01930 [Candidatus Pacearchaeota archaeon]|nr:hypothetical protein [Candidatus Pacearchaeota archaeon]